MKNKKFKHRLTPCIWKKALLNSGEITAAEADKLPKRLHWYDTPDWFRSFCFKIFQQGKEPRIDLKNGKMYLGECKKYFSDKLPPFAWISAINNSLGEPVLQYCSCKKWDMVNESISDRCRYYSTMGFRPVLVTEKSRKVILEGKYEIIFPERSVWKLQEVI